MTNDVPDRQPLRVSVLRELLLAPNGPLSRLEVVETAASTSTALGAALAEHPEDWPDRSVLVADHQSAGRGRSDHGWVVPPRAALTFSMLVRPDGPVPGLAWLPLLTGLACVNALRATAGVRAFLKWPNDILVTVPDATAVPGWGQDRKVAGILCELTRTATGPAVVVGVGINVSQRPEELPVPHAGSLVTVGAVEPDRETVLAAVLAAMAAVDDRWRAARGDAIAAGLADEVAAVCTTLGMTVDVGLPGGTHVQGIARGLGLDGSLILHDAAGREHVVRAGDVRHVRPAG